MIYATSSHQPSIWIYDRCGTGRYRPRTLLFSWREALRWMDGEVRIAISITARTVTVYRG